MLQPTLIHFCHTSVLLDRDTAKLGKLLVLGKLEFVPPLQNHTADATLTDVLLHNITFFKCSCTLSW